MVINLIIRKLLLAQLFSFIILVTPVLTKDYVSKLLGNTVATFSDALELLYNSLNPVELSKNKKNKEAYEKQAKKQQKIDIKQMQDFLKKHNIYAPSLSLSQPMKKQEFAKLLFKRLKICHKVF